MSLRVVFDESHGEQISSVNCRGIEYVLEKLKIIHFRLISGPLTIDKIGSEDVLFLGAPTKKFFDFEIKTLKYFVSKGNFLIIVCPVPIAFNFTLNEVIKNFGMQFELNIVQDKKHSYNDASYFPIIKQFNDDLITHDLKELVYSGCSIKKLSSDVKTLAFSDRHAEPPSVPVVAAAQNGRVICIGGSSLFQDDKRTGIKAKNNIRFVANLFRAIIQRREKAVEVQKAAKPEKPKKLKEVDPKKAKKHFEKLTDDAIIKMKKKSEEIDDLFGKITKLITWEKFSMAEQTLKKEYKKFKITIENIYQTVMEKHEELSDRITQEIAFSTLVKESTDQLLVVESEALTKLDMIRFNLSNQISKEKLRSSNR